MKFAKFILALVALSSAAFGQATVSQTSIRRGSAVVSANSDGSISMQTAAGQPVGVYSSSAYFQAGPITLGSLAPPAVSGAGLANIYFNGTGILTSVNGGAYAPISTDLTSGTSAINVDTLVANHFTVGTDSSISIMGDMRFQGSQIYTGSGNPVSISASNGLATVRVRTNQVLIDNWFGFPSPFGGAAFASNSGEMQVMDSSGNVTTISPHAKDAPTDLYEQGLGVDEMHCTANVFTGVVQWWATTRRNTLDALDLAARLGTPEQSSAAWAEVIERQQHNRMRCSAIETFAEFEARTGKSLWPGFTPEARAEWAAMTPDQRKAKSNSTSPQ